MACAIKRRVEAERTDVFYLVSHSLDVRSIKVQDKAREVDGGQMHTRTHTHTYSADH